MLLILLHQQSTFYYVLILFANYKQVSTKFLFNKLCRPQTGIKDIYIGEMKLAGDFKQSHYLEQRKENYFFKINRQKKSSIHYFSLFVIISISSFNTVVVTDQPMEPWFKNPRPLGVILSIHRYTQLLKNKCFLNIRNIEIYFG